MKQLQQVVGDLFGAGTETTTNTLMWAIIYMLHNPDVVRNVQGEIERVLGKKLPSMKDKQDLPYVEATVMEIQRMSEIVPLGVPHSVLEDVEFRGYTIPKGTTVMSNLYAVHRDERIWDQPDVFKPSRFLNENGRIVRQEQLIPFCIGNRLSLVFSNCRLSICFPYFVQSTGSKYNTLLISGKRACLGEALARMELFLFFTTMFQHFTFELPPGEKLPSLVGRLSITHVPPPFNINAKERY